jgi:hypothetical protein
VKGIDAYSVRWRDRFVKLVALRRNDDASLPQRAHAAPPRRPSRRPQTVWRLLHD